jgi:hypothetical protein
MGIAKAKRVLARRRQKTVDDLATIQQLKCFLRIFVPILSI